MNLTYKYGKEVFKGRRFVMGDIHGCHKGMVQALERSGFDYENDLLIQLGDIVDGWSQTKECILEMQKIKNKIHLLGNHDEWARKYYIHGDKNIAWWVQGGKQTVDSLGIYGEQDDNLIYHLDTALLYCEIDSKIFAHGSIPSKSFDMNKMAANGTTYHFIWDRLPDRVWRDYCLEKEVFDDRWDELYVGHTPVSTITEEEIHDYKPLKMCNVWCCDTEAGRNGYVSIMDIDTKQTWKSDWVRELYPNEPGRNEYSLNEERKTK